MLGAQRRLRAVGRQLQAEGEGEWAVATVVSDEVRAALSERRAVVALESTIVSHGMPFPQNLETARALEAIVRAHGAVPATVALLDGAVHVGLDAAALERLARSGPAAAKVSVRDVGTVLAAGAGAVGATTVAATAHLAARAGVHVFATGGIGGVHRGGESSMDVSADLATLASTPICVVCAGAKSLLDIPRTLEVLETLGVPAVALGQRDFPAFFVRDSGVAAAARFDAPEDVARAFALGRAAGLRAGMVVGVPIPAADEAEGRVVEDAIQRAIQEAEAQRVAGRDLTPFLLRRVSELTGGSSLRANIALVKNNAAVAAAIAVELARLAATAAGDGRCAPAPEVVVVGGAFVDVLAATGSAECGGSGGGGGGKPRGAVRMTSGGVGRNISEALARLGVATQLVSAVGRDAGGRMVLRGLAVAGVDASGVRVVPGERTGTFVAVRAASGGGGGAVHTVSDTARLETQLDEAWLRGRVAGLAGARAVVVDLNVSAAVLAAVAQVRARARGLLWVECTGRGRAEKLARSPLFIFDGDAPLFRPGELGEWAARPTLVLAANEGELRELAAAVAAETAPSRGDDDDYERQARAVLARCGASAVVVTRGALGAAVVTPAAVRVAAVPASCALASLPLVSDVGAGDCLSAAFLATLLRTSDAARALARGLRSALLSTRDEDAVPAHLSAAVLDAMEPA
jgi:pseudouridine-5'-phosphate glycosidase/sugar/nucleoside kinase (ribokinase family)